MSLIHIGERCEKVGPAHDPQNNAKNLHNKGKEADREQISNHKPMVISSKKKKHMVLIHLHFKIPPFLKQRPLMRPYATLL